MELGNYVFGHSRGEVPIPREDAFEEPIHNLIEHLGRFLGRDLCGYGAEFENEIFSMFPYYWGCCTCGYEDKANEWSDNHEHSKCCYQTEYATISSLPREKEEALAKELCKKHNIPWNDGLGSAVHCTCDFEKEWEKFVAANEHSDSCPIVTPNFVYKPTGYTLMWYKYPLRDSYGSHEVSPQEWEKMMNHCVESLTK